MEKENLSVEEAYRLGAEAMRSCIAAWLVVEGRMDPAAASRILTLPTPDFQIPEGVVVKKADDS